MSLVYILGDVSCVYFCYDAISSFVGSSTWWYLITEVLYLVLSFLSWHAGRVAFDWCFVPCSYCVGRDFSFVFRYLDVGWLLSINFMFLLFLLAFLCLFYFLITFFGHIVFPVPLHPGCKFIFLCIVLADSLELVGLAFFVLWENSLFDPFLKSSSLFDPKK